MSERSSARHRAPARPLTPFDSLTDTLTGQLSAVGDQLGSVGRSGAVLAVSTGLVATMGMPASAVTKTAPENGVSLSRPSVVTAAAVALPASVVSGAAVTAPSTANVSFERSTLTVKKAAPKPKARVVERASRSAVRAAAPVRKTSAVKSSTKKASSPGRSVDTSSIVSIARSLLGIPYVYGGTTTAGFDCSGFSKYVYGKAGISLPRTSGAQYAAVTHLSRSQARPGDLVFIFSGGRVTHVGIFTGGNRMIDSPRSGKSTQEREIWSSNIAFGRP
ncbi:C40 family peptidase [Kineosporia sp. A_224]|uniref:C40 family peptidase n=1 Tax=Kineosporia sp. A_224 TaxID=1962180 RepID=UPI000B4B9AD7|nr:C40 family peptidase [Kineosporia sp. A_224]